MSDLSQTIQRVLDLDREATGGPWDVGHPPPNGQQTIGSGGLMLAITTTYDQRDKSNAALIAEYRTAAPELARALLAEQGRVADLERQIAALVAPPRTGDDMLPLPTGPRGSEYAVAHAMSGMPKVGRKSIDIHVYDYLRAEVNALRAELQAANARADAAEANVILWRGQTQQADADLARVTKDRDDLTSMLVKLFDWSDTSYVHAIMHVENAVGNLRADLAVERADLARVTAERDDLAKRAFNLADEVEQSQDCGNSQDSDCCGECVACRDVTFADTVSQLAAARQAAEALRAQVAELLADSAGMRMRDGSAPPAPAPAPDLAFGNLAYGMRYTIAADRETYMLFESTDRERGWCWKMPGILSQYAPTEADAIAAANAHNRQRLAGVK